MNSGSVGKGKTMVRSYMLMTTETAALTKFEKKHWKKCKGLVSITFTETGIGQAITVCCKKCSKIKDITDYSDW